MILGICLWYKVAVLTFSAEHRNSYLTRLDSRASLLISYLLHFSPQVGKVFRLYWYLLFAHRAGVKGGFEGGLREKKREVSKRQRRYLLGEMVLVVEGG